MIKRIVNRVRRALAEGGWVVALAVFLLSGILATADLHPVKRGVEVITSAREVSAADICKRDETKLAFVTNHDGLQHYAARYESASVRYDLTWLPTSSSVVVEQLRGRDLDMWVEQITADFSACVASKPVEHVSVH